jgi:hypothetical protein
VDPVTAAIVTGAVASLSGAASISVRDAYDALKTRLGDHFPRLDVGAFEEHPGSTVGQGLLAAEVARLGADRDPEVVRLAWSLVGVVAREAPWAAVTAGIDLDLVKGQFVNVQLVNGGVGASAGSDPDS